VKFVGKVLALYIGLHSGTEFSDSFHEVNTLPQPGNPPTLVARRTKGADSTCRLQEEGYRQKSVFDLAIKQIMLYHNLDTN